MKETLNVLEFGLMIVVGLVSLYTAKVVSDLKVWILTREQEDLKFYDSRYVSKAVFEQFQRTCDSRHEGGGGKSAGA